MKKEVENQQKKRRVAMSKWKMENGNKGERKKENKGNIKKD